VQRLLGKKSKSGELAMRDTLHRHIGAVDLGVELRLVSAAAVVAYAAAIVRKRLGRGQVRGLLMGWLYGRRGGGVEG
jgi:hypothetical protein